jgi:hypothetical protein
MTGPEGSMTDRSDTLDHLRAAVDRYLQQTEGNVSPAVYMQATAEFRWSVYPHNIAELIELADLATVKCTRYYDGQDDVRRQLRPQLIAADRIADSLREMTLGPYAQKALDAYDHAANPQGATP